MEKQSHSQLYDKITSKSDNLTFVFPIIYRNRNSLFRNYFTFNGFVLLVVKSLWALTLAGENPPKSRSQFRRICPFETKKLMLSSSHLEVRKLNV